MLLSSVAVQTLVITELLPVPATVVSAYVTVTSLSQLSLAAAVPVAEGSVLALHSTVTFAGEVVNVGAVVSLGITSKVHVETFPAASVAVIVTVVVEVIVVPDAGLCVIVTEWVSVADASDV